MADKSYARSLRDIKARGLMRNADVRDYDNKMTLTKHMFGVEHAEMNDKLKRYKKALLDATRAYDKQLKLSMQLAQKMKNVVLGAESRIGTQEGHITDLQKKRNALKSRRFAAASDDRKKLSDNAEQRQDRKNELHIMNIEMQRLKSRAQGVDFSGSVKLAPLPVIKLQTKVVKKVVNKVVTKVVPKIVRESESGLSTEEFKKLMKRVDQLLGMLPEKEVKQFSSSADFEAYEKVLDRYGI